MMYILISARPYKHRTMIKLRTNIILRTKIIGIETYKRHRDL